MTTTAPAETALASCRGASVVYGSGANEVGALRDVDLDVQPQESVALWGRSGSGKTTLLHVLGGLLTPTGGAVEWCGEPLSSLDAAARGRLRARSIAYVFQSASLLPYFTAYENVAFARHVSAGDAASSAPNPEELLALVGLGDKLDSLSGELSGGEAQRVAIARALAQSPQLLLCDEPTGHLDSDTGKRVLDLIDALRKEFSFAFVLATHDAEVAARCDRVVSLSDGRVVSDEVAAA